eukprot:1611683-Pleurochrysis_carterae.AAC.1
MDRYARRFRASDLMSYSIPSAYTSEEDGARAVSRMHCSTRTRASASSRAVAMPCTVMMRR